MYSVFYNEAEKSFFQLKTDFPNIEMAELFIQSDYFRTGQLHFIFLLKDGSDLIKGTPLHNTKEHFKQAMMFAVDIPVSHYKLF